MSSLSPLLASCKALAARSRKFATAFESLPSATRDSDSKLQPWLSALDCPLTPDQIQARTIIATIVAKLNEEDS